MNGEILQMSVIELDKRLKSGDITSTEATRAYLERIDSKDGQIGAYITVTGERALKAARAADERLAKGDLTPLLGVPTALKDNICTKGTLTTCASKMLADFIPPYDAAVVERLNGAVLLGKLNMDEFAMGSSTESSYFKLTRNPRDLSRVPGGSSGGSAAAAAAFEAPFTLGSDTGGSIRQPAAFCGVVGLKPTYGLVSRYGLVAFASSLDQIGPITRNVADAAAVLNVIAGFDRRDSTSVFRPAVDYTLALGRDIGGLRVALPRELHDDVSGAVKQTYIQTAKAFERLGAVLVDVQFKTLKYALPAYYIISSAEASSNLGRFDGVKYGYRAKGRLDIGALFRQSRSQGLGAEVKRRIMLGNFVLSWGCRGEYYEKASRVRTLVIRDYTKIFEQADVILSPAAHSAAYKIGEKPDFIERYWDDFFTAPVNLAGLPALSLNCGFDNALPIGLQLIGRPFDETTLISAAYALEQALEEGNA